MKSKLIWLTTLAAAVACSALLADPQSGMKPGINGEFVTPNPPTLAIAIWSNWPPGTVTQSTNATSEDRWILVQSNTIPHPVLIEHVVNGRTIESLEVMDTNTLPRLIRSGEVCKIVGHAWRDGRPGESETIRFSDLHTGTIFRTCQICGICQSKTEGIWK